MRPTVSVQSRTGIRFCTHYGYGKQSLISPGRVYNVTILIMVETLYSLWLRSTVLHQSRTGIQRYCTHYGWDQQSLISPGRVYYVRYCTNYGCTQQYFISTGQVYYVSLLIMGEMNSLASVQDRYIAFLYQPSIKDRCIFYHVIVLIVGEINSLSTVQDGRATFLYPLSKSLSSVQDGHITFLYPLCVRSTVSHQFKTGILRSCTHYGWDQPSLISPGPVPYVSVLTIRDHSSRPLGSPGTCVQDIFVLTCGWDQSPWSIIV